MKKLIAESLGTCFIMLVMLLSPAQFMPFAVGAILMALTYTGAAVSGAHYNPAVSLAMLIQGKITRDEFPAYFVAQLLGAGLAALFAGFLIACTDHPTVVVHTNRMICAILAEFLGAFILVYMYINAMLSPKLAGNAHYGIIIGVTLMALMTTFGSISGGLFNPALAFGGAIMGTVSWADLWIYLVANLLGAAAATTVFTLVNEEG